MGKIKPWSKYQRKPITYDFQGVTWFIGKQKQNQHSGFESLSEQWNYFRNFKKSLYIFAFFWFSLIVSRFWLTSPNTASVFWSNEGHLQFLLLPNSSIACEVTGKRMIGGGGYNLDIPVKYEFNPLATNVRHHIETSQLVCRANHLTGFYMIVNIGR